MRFDPAGIPILYQKFDEGETIFFSVSFHLEIIKDDVKYRIFKIIKKNTT